MKKARIEATVLLTKNTCYFMKTGKCSLGLISDFEFSGGKIAQNDLMYCPKLLRAMRSKEKLKPITLTPCRCGHGQIVSGQQQACIASQCGFPVVVQPADDDVLENCDVCGGQITLEQNLGGQRIINLIAMVSEDE